MLQIIESWLAAWDCHDRTRLDDGPRIHKSVPNAFQQDSHYGSRRLCFSSPQHPLRIRAGPCPASLPLKPQQTAAVSAEWQRGGRMEEIWRHAGNQWQARFLVAKADRITKCLFGSDIMTCLVRVVQSVMKTRRRMIKTWRWFHDLIPPQWTAFGAFGPWGSTWPPVWYRSCLLFVIYKCTDFIHK